MTDNEGIFGIDLGTTYSAVAYIDQTGRPTVVRNGAGHETTPSVVHFENESNVVVGQVAKESAVISPDEVVSLVKREMGNRDYVRRMFGKEYTAPAISALILDALARSAEAETGRKAGKIVITVPAYFGMLEKEATRQAGQIAGLNVIGIVPEPVAAALAYGLGGDADGKTILVYDLGGGTFDVTIMRIGTAEIEVLVVGGDHKLGGADWDEMLFNHLVAEVSGQVGDDSILDDDHLVQEIWNLAEKTKKELSEAETRPAIIRHSGGSAKITVSRAQFEQLTAHLVQQTIDITERTLAEAEGLYPGVEAEITDVLLVGGSSKMPAVSAAISHAFGWVPRLADPDLAVAKGAALYAAGRVVQEIVDRSAPVSGSTAAASSSRSPDLDADSLTAAQVEEIEKVVGLEAATAVEIGKREVVNALPKAVGIKLIDTEVPNWEQLQPMPTYIRHLVHAQTPLPYKSADPYLAATVMPNQDEIEIEIWEQAGAVAGREIHENTFLPPPGHIKNLAGSRLPAGSRIDVHFDVSLEGIVRVRAVEPTSGNDVTVEARIALLSDTQMEQAKAIAAGVTVTT